MIERGSDEWWERYNNFEQNIKDKIAEFGWTGIGVFPTEQDPGAAFTYSVGFTALGQPEVIIYGIGNERAHQLLWRVYELLEEGVSFEEGKEYEDILADGYKVTFRVVPGDGHPANVARRIYEGDIKLLQLVWPDVNGCYPWQGGWDCRDSQPVLADEPGHPDLGKAA